MNDEQVIEQPTQGRNPLFLLVGLAFLGFALAFLIFGGSLFDGGRVNDSQGGGLDPLVAGTPQSNSSAFTLPTDALKVGDTAPNFVLADVAGNRVALNDFHGKPIIINFWATWCPPCRFEMPDLQHAFEANESDELMILAINKEESAETVTAFFHDEMGLTFTPLLDPSSTISDLYGAFNLPTSYFVNAKGKITVVHRGAMTLGQIEGYLAQTLP